VSQGRPALLCSETARPISHKNEWFDDLFFAFLWFFFPYAPFLVTSYILLSWNKEMHLLKSNFLSSQMKSHSFSPSSLPLHKAKWVQLNGKTLQVLKNSLVRTVFKTKYHLHIVCTEVNWAYVGLLWVYKAYHTITEKPTTELTDNNYYNWICSKPRVTLLQVYVPIFSVPLS
jgi:hypothetical protein